MHAIASGTGPRRGAAPSRRASSRFIARLAALIALSIFAGPSTPAADSPADAYRAPFPGRLAHDGDLLYALNDSTEPGNYAHPAGLYRIQFPPSWRMIRNLVDGRVAATFSPEAGRVPPKLMRVGVKVQAVVMADVFRRQHMSAVAIMRHLLPGLLRDNPGMKLRSDVAAAKLGGLDAAMCSLEGKWEEQPGDSIREILIAERAGTVFQLSGFAPAGEFAAFRETFLKVARESSFGRSGLARRDDSFEARRIVQKYKGSVVSIVAANDQKAGTGTGFIVSRDGYILTNYHVAFDMQGGEPMKNFTVEWDESLRRPKLPARLVGGRLRLSPYQLQHGTDVALLKIAPGDYEPFPLSPLADVEPGDGVVTLGFPSRGLLEGISLTVTSGVVTRFNRGPQGNIDSVFVDAAFTHGSSGGPCVSLVTGGVIGLNSFGMDVQVDPRMSKLNDLIKYHGVVPIDAALREFPLIFMRGANADGSGFDFLDCLEVSKYFLSVGSLRAAEQLAVRAVSLEPNESFARMRLGECRFDQAVEKQLEGADPKAQALFEAARQAYTEALARDPKRPEVLTAFARLEIQQNRLPEAAALAARAADAEPKGWAGNLLLADIRFRESRFDDALRYVQKAKAVVGGLIVNPHVTAAQIFAAKGDYAKARDEWAEAARISTVYLPARLGVAAYHEQVNQMDQAVAAYRRVLDDFPDNGEVLGRIGLCLNRAGRTAEAANFFAQSVRRCQAAGQAPDESVLMFFGDFLAQRPDSAEAVPIYAAYLFHHRGGQWAALASLKLAAIHLQHQAPGLASVHARLAMQLRAAPEVAQAAQQYQPAALALDEIRAMLQLQYPLALAAQLVADSPLGFALNEQQLAQLQQEGMPEPVLKAILVSLSRHRSLDPPSDASGGIGPSDFAPPGNERFIPPGAAPVVPAPPPTTTSGIDLRGTWAATGMTTQQAPFRSVIIFGEFGLFTSETWVAFQSLGSLSGTYRLENGRLILQPEGGRPFVSNFQQDGNAIVMDVPNFAPGLRFFREAAPGGFQF
jgi:tetratricopeptide (TPR) repeat protein